LLIRPLPSNTRIRRSVISAMWFESITAHQRTYSPFTAQTVRALKQGAVRAILTSVGGG